jgi:uncharacterized membrane protein YvlD (DUF360 family)
MKEHRRNAKNIQLKPLGYMLGIVIILFGLFTFVIPFILGLPSNYNQNMPFPITGVVCIVLGGIVMTGVKLFPCSKIKL